MSIMMYMLRNVIQQSRYSPQIGTALRASSSQENQPLSPRMQEFKEKLRQRTPINSIKELEGKHPNEENEPLQPWPDNKNPHTGEVNGPKGPEPTRYGDWERKGRVTDF